VSARAFARARAADLVVAIARTRAFEAIVRLGERTDPAPAGWLHVLTYHRVDERDARPHLSPAVLSASPREYRAQMEFIAARCRPVSIAEVLEARRTGEALPPRAVLVTIDDGYRDVAEHQWPVLKELGIPALLFVPTAIAANSSGYWWDRLWNAVRVTELPRLEVGGRAMALVTADDRRAAYRLLLDQIKDRAHEDGMALVDETVAALAPDAMAAPAADHLGWADIAALAADGLAVAPHSRTHPVLTRLDPDQLRDEIAGSAADLARALGRPALPAFCYPTGRYSDEVVRAVAEAGFEVAFTTDRGSNEPGRTDWLRLRRINVGQRTSLALLRAQLLMRVSRLFRASRGPASGPGVSSADGGRTAAPAAPETHSPPRAGVG
jgi:peptidoglycan/xylan/chitin deacetylase (PgdA/CDA1 family)